MTTRDRILDAGANLLSTSGLHGLTLGILASRTGLSKSGLFAHFRSKDEVQLALLDRTARFANEYVVAPALEAPEGLPRLKALVNYWLGWSKRAGLDGGCAIAAGIFELDDAPGPVRDRLQQLDSVWRDLLVAQVNRAIALGHLRNDTDAGQFVFELCGIYLSHHAYSRFNRDPQADHRAATALNALVAHYIKPKRNTIA